MFNKKNIELHNDLLIKYIPCYYLIAVIKINRFNVGLSICCSQTSINLFENMPIY